MTETTGALAKALAEFQAEMPTVTKGQTADAGSYSYKYADLAAISKATMPLLTSHGLSFSCGARQTESGYELVGHLMHTSGEKVEGALPIQGRNAQELGSSITYMRRYLFGMLTGVVTDEDDDGAAASKPVPQETPRQAAQRGIAQASDETALDQVVAWMVTQGLDADEELVAQVKERREALAGAA